MVHRLQCIHSVPPINIHESVAQVIQIRELLHELSNVLTGVLITAGLLKQYEPLSLRGERYASDLESGAHQGADLVVEVRNCVHGLQSLLTPPESTTLCDVRPSLGQKDGEN